MSIDRSDAVKGVLTALSWMMPPVNGVVAC